MVSNKVSILSYFFLLFVVTTVFVSNEFFKLESVKDNIIGLDHDFIIDSDLQLDSGELYRFGEFDQLVQNLEQNFLIKFDFRIRFNDIFFDIFGNDSLNYLGEPAITIDQIFDASDNNYQYYDNLITIIKVPEELLETETIYKINSSIVTNLINKNILFVPEKLPTGLIEVITTVDALDHFLDDLLHLQLFLDYDFTNDAIWSIDDLRNKEQILYDIIISDIEAADFGKLSLIITRPILNELSSSDNINSQLMEIIDIALSLIVAIFILFILLEVYYQYNNREKREILFFRGASDKQILYFTTIKTIIRSSIFLFIFLILMIIANLALSLNAFIVFNISIILLFHLLYLSIVLFTGFLFIKLNNIKKRINFEITRSIKFPSKLILLSLLGIIFILLALFLINKLLPGELIEYKITNDTIQSFFKLVIAVFIIGALQSKYKLFIHISKSNTIPNEVFYRLFTKMKSLRFILPLILIIVIPIFTSQISYNSIALQRIENRSISQPGNITVEIYGNSLSEFTLVDFVNFINNYSIIEDFTITSYLTSTDQSILFDGVAIAVIYNLGFWYRYITSENHEFDTIDNATVDSLKTNGNGIVKNTSPNKKNDIINLEIVTNSSIETGELHQLNIKIVDTFDKTLPGLDIFVNNQVIISNYTLPLSQIINHNSKTFIKFKENVDKQIRQSFILDMKNKFNYDIDYNQTSSDNDYYLFITNSQKFELMIAIFINLFTIISSFIIISGDMEIISGMMRLFWLKGMKLKEIKIQLMKFGIFNIFADMFIVTFLSLYTMFTTMDRNVNIYDYSVGRIIGKIIGYVIIPSSIIIFVTYYIRLQTESRRIKNEYRN